MRDHAFHAGKQSLALGLEGGDRAQALLEHLARIDERVPAYEQLRERVGGGRRGLPNYELRSLVYRVARNELRIDAIGLAALANSTRVVLEHLRIEHQHHHAGGVCRVREQPMIFTGGLHRHHTARWNPRKPRRNRFSGIINPPDRLNLIAADLERRLRNIYPMHHQLVIHDRPR